MDISNWTAPGNFNGKPAMAAASREEIKDEVWAQLKAALNGRGRPTIDDDNLVDWFLDPDIQLPNPGTVTNAEPLLINHAGSLALRPEAHTEIGNLLLAADYVRTHTDLATMEAANEAARRATNAILARVRGRRPAVRALGVRHSEADAPGAGARPDAFPDGTAQPAPGGLPTLSAEGQAGIARSLCSVHGEDAAGDMANTARAGE